MPELPPDNRFPRPARTADLGDRPPAPPTLLRRAQASLRPDAASGGLRPYKTWIGRLTLIAAILLVLARMVIVPPSLTQIGTSIAATGLLLLCRFFFSGRIPERDATLVMPLALALGLWLPGESALIGALASGLFWTLAREKPDARDTTFQRAAQMTLGLGAAEWVAGRLSFPFASEARFLAPRLFLPSFAQAWQTLGAAALVGITYAFVYLLLVFLANVGRWQALWLQCQRIFAVQASGLLLIVLLVPLGTTWGIVIVLPCLAFLALLGQFARMTSRAYDLQGQLAASEAMSRAGIAQSDTEEEPDQLLQHFLTLAQRLVPTDRGIVWTLNQETGVLSPAVGLPDPGPYAGDKATFGQGLIGHAAARFRPRRLENAATDPHRAPNERVFGAMLLYPITVHARLLGVAQWIRSVEHPFTRAEVARLDSLVPQAAIALENARVREAMRDLASTDGLTGLWNHRRMQEILREEVRRAARYRRAVSVLMMDVDSFKSFNDTYGHPQGDNLLRSLASVLKSNIRLEDAVGRYGGEEFMIILPETQKDAAFLLADRIRAKIETQAVVMIEGEAIRRTVSIGLASFPEDGDAASELVQCADNALYRAKRDGKNRVVWG